jgi:hypothetical protein
MLAQLKVAAEPRPVDPTLPVNLALATEVITSFGTLCFGQLPDKTLTFLLQAGRLSGSCPRDKATPVIEAGVWVGWDEPA